jgi:hypothetical protein
MALSETEKEGIASVELLDLISAYCYDSSRINEILAEQGMSNPNDFNYKFSQKILKVAKNTIDHGLKSKNSAKLIITGAMLIQGVVQSYNDCLNDENLVEVLKFVCDLVGRNLRKTNNVFSCCVSLLLVILGSRPIVCLDVLHTN